MKRLPFSAFVLACLAGAPGGTQSPVLFDTYARTGETGAVSFTGTDEFIRALRSSGIAWMNAAPPDERDRRRHLLAQLALETAWSSAPSTRDGLLILEWGCDLLRQRPVSEYERAWMVASASLFLRADFEDRFHQYGRTAPMIRRPSAMGHLDHALDRSPQDPRLQLMRLMRRPEVYALSSRPGGNPDQLVRVPAYEAQSGLRGRPRIADAIARLSAIASGSEAGAEARAHVAWLKFHLNELDASLDDFRISAGATSDSFTRNLAMTGAGLALTAQGKAAEAIAALRSAVDSMPGARAPAIVLATQLFLTGERREAAQIVDRTFGPDALELEPWRHPLQFDRFAASDFGELRRQLGLPVRAIERQADRPSGERADSTSIEADSAAVAQTSPAMPAQAMPAFRSSANAVTLDVLVVSGNAPAAGLTAADFDVFDNGVRQSVEVAAVEAIPIDISLVIELYEGIWVGPSAHERALGLLDRTREDMLAVAQALRRDDRLRLLQVDDNVGRELWRMQAPPFPIDRLPTPRQLNDQSEATYGRIQSLYDVVAAALLRETPADRRHLVVVFTNGVDGASALPPDLFVALARESSSVMYLARRDTQMEYAVKLEALTGKPYSQIARPYSHLLWPPDPRIIERATESTGGSVYYRPQGSLLPDFREIFDRFRKSYVIRYQPTSATPGWHDVSVKVLKPGRYDVRVKKGYTITK